MLVPLHVFFLSEAAGLALGLEEAEDVIDANWALDVADDGTGLVVHKLYADLGDTTTRTGTAQNAGNFDKLNGGL